LLSAWVPVYQYEFNDSHPPNIFLPNPVPFGAYHAAEIQYILGWMVPKKASTTPAQQGLAESMKRYWINFISVGDPGGTSPRWVPFHVDQPRILSLSPETISYESDFASAHHCDLWNSIRPQR
jgi:para-nitrobenzyl esterase